MQRDDASLLDIFNAARLALSFVDDMSETHFAGDSKTQSSVLYQLLVIGKATKRLSSEFRAAHSAIPWFLMSGMRDHLIHAYDTVDWEEVWNTVTDDLPALLEQIEPLLPERPADS